MSEVKFDIPVIVDGVEPPNRDLMQLQQRRRVWVETGAALIQTCRRGADAKMTWLTSANRYMSSDRTSFYIERQDTTRFMSYKEAAAVYMYETVALEGELMRLRRGRLRFPYH